MKKKSKPSPPSPQRGRRRLSGNTWSGRVTREGEDHALLTALEEAARARGPFERATHGFHSHPARLHPDAARTLLAALPGEGGVVLDPFCGGGTVLVEAMLAGRPAIGRDINPISTRIAQARTRQTSAAERSALLASARDVSKGASTQTRASRSPRLPDAVWALRDWYSKQAIQELGWLWGLIPKQPRALRPTLKMVHASLVVKFSMRASETSRRRVNVKYPAGAVCDLFEKRAALLVSGLDELANTAPDGTPSARVERGDARRLEGLETPVELVVTSPPYPATYDYLLIQQLREAWLGINLQPVLNAEMGSRRAFRADPRDALRQWKADTHAWIGAVSQVLRPGGALAVVIGDGVSHDRLLHTLRPTLSAATAAGLTLRARLSVERKDQGASVIRPEHFIVFEKPA